MPNKNLEIREKDVELTLRLKIGRRCDVVLWLSGDRD